jgi:hypothetical protein
MMSDRHTNQKLSYCTTPGDSTADHMGVEGVRDGVGQGGELVLTVCFGALDGWGKATGIVVVVVVIIVICRVVTVRHFGFEGCCIVGFGKGGLIGGAAAVLGLKVVGFFFPPFPLHPLCLSFVLVGVSLQVCPQRSTSSSTSSGSRRGLGYSFSVHLVSLGDKMHHCGIRRVHKRETFVLVCRIGRGSFALGASTTSGPLAAMGGGGSVGGDMLVARETKQLKHKQ